MGRRGTLVDEGDYATLTFRRVYRHQVEHVWDAIATPEGLSAWLMCSQALIEGQVGGRFEMVSGPAQYRSTGKVLAWDPPRLLEYQWNVDPVAEMPEGERAIFRFELTPDGESTHLVVTYRKMTHHTARGFLPGLHAFLDRLEEQLAGRALPNWQERFGALCAEYPEWQGHAPTARK